jgi:small subunit ribosomal protein S17
MARKEKTKVEAKAIAEAKIKGRVGTRGRIFEGTVTWKFPKRVVIEFERMIYIKKYERYAKLKTKIHARLPEFLEKEINLGDLIRVHECRPLSKIIHFVVVQKLKDAKEVGK